MKLKSKKDEHDSLGMDAGKEFTIDTESHMIVSILRDKLYKNKVGAVCREIASNGRDANREAGKENVPVEIRIHDDSDLIGEGSTLISFKDSGVGISPDRIDNIFLKYGGSTKRDSNNQTGGFGIGAKTPFAYTNNFLITTVAEVDGKKIEYIYQALIVADGISEKSQLILVSEEETTNPTGTIITVPIGGENDDFNLEQRIREFEWECIHATAMWDVKPTLIGFGKRFNQEVYDNRDLEVVAKGTNWSVVKDPNSLLNSKHCVVASVDGIPYSIDSDEINDHNLKEKLENFFDYYADDLVPVLHIKTGEISLSASREDVEYIKENLNFLIEKYDVMKKELKEQAKKLIADAKTPLEKATIFNKIRGYASTKDTELDKLCETYGSVLGDLKDALLTEEEEKQIPLRMRDLGARHSFVLISMSNPSYQSVITRHSIDIEDFKNLPIFYRARNSCSARNSTILKADEFRENDNRKCALFVMPVKDGREYLQTGDILEQKKKIVKFFKQSGLEVKEYEDVEKDKTATSGSGFSYDKEFEGSVNVPIRVKSTYKGWDPVIVECGRGKDKKPNGKILTDGYTGAKTIMFTLPTITSLKENSNCYGRLPEEQRIMPDYMQAIRYGNWDKTINMLTKAGYKIIAVSDNKAKYFAKCRFKTGKDIPALIDSIVSTKEFKDAIQNWLDYEASQVVDLDDYVEQTYIEHSEFLELGGIDPKVLKLCTEKMEEAENFVRTQEAYNINYDLGSEAIRMLAEKFEITAKDFGVFLTENDIDKAFEYVKKKYPLIHYLMDKIVDGSWREFDAYDGNKFGKDGKELFLDMVKEMIKVELDKKKKEDKAKAKKK